MVYSNLLIVAGTGTKSGKTSLVCKIVKQLKELKIIAVKITPHFHETTDGLILIYEQAGYAIYEETNRDTRKDTSRMLDAGASRVYFAKVWDDKLQEAFNKIMELIPPGSPVICESPAVRKFFEPGLFIIMTSTTINKHKNISDLEKLPHVMLELEKINSTDMVPVVFEGGSWRMSQEFRYSTPLP